MSTHFIRYYVIRDSLRFINSNITYMQDTSNQRLFHAALFYDCNEFYKIRNPFKMDPYQISIKIKEQFLPFLKECLESAYFHAAPLEKLFCYYLLISFITQKYIEDYIQSLVSQNQKKETIEQLLETYFFNKNEKMKLHKVNISDYFFDAFEMRDSDLQLLEKPVKRLFGFFCIENYYRECYQSARFYFDHLASGNAFLKKPFFVLYDFFLNHRKNKKKAKYYLYPKRIDTTILNLTKNTYILKNQEVNYSIDELYQEIIKESRKACDTLNSYFTGNQNEKPLDKYFQAFYKDVE